MSPALRGEVSERGVQHLAGANSRSEREPLETLSRKEWKGKPPIDEMKEHVPDRITIHHTATLQNEKLGLADSRGQNAGWLD